MRGCRRLERGESQGDDSRRARKLALAAYDRMTEARRRRSRVRDPDLPASRPRAPAAALLTAVPAPPGRSRRPGALVCSGERCTDG